MLFRKNKCKYIRVTVDKDDVVVEMFGEEPDVVESKTCKVYKVEEELKLVKEFLPPKKRKKGNVGDKVVEAPEGRKFYE